jgi:aspartokinase/homoserine dehydrogenase 1
MNSLTNSGDKIVKLQAVLSGTLNFIFNTISEKVPFSKAIKMAVEAQFAEPDPRIDLSGLDVTRKLVILSREAGAQIEQEDVNKRLFIPEKYFKAPSRSFGQPFTKWTKASRTGERSSTRRGRNSGL